MINNIDFSIITPSYNMLRYLKRAAASIADQTGVTCEHIVVDAVSTDGSVEWLREQKMQIKSIIEKDNGMYNALNKGFKITKGDILGYLNCDEQYLPGTLAKVHNYFKKNPHIDMVFGNALITDPDGKLLSFRKAYRPSYNYIITSILYNLSCTMFFRKKIIESGIEFNTTFKIVGDADFVLKILKKGYKTGYINEYLSVFTWTGNNMSIGKNAIKEKRLLRNSTPKIIRFISTIINALRLIEKFLSGAYHQKFPLQYEIYTSNLFNKRFQFKCKKATFRWPK